MDAGAAAWLVILLALVLANLPFFNDRILALFPLPSNLNRGSAASGAGQSASEHSPAGDAGKPGSAAKPFLIRLFELILLYLIVGAIGLALEARIGTAFPQTWEFYAISACTFLVFAFPGFVLRYLRKR